MQPPEPEKQSRRPLLSRQRSTDGTHHASIPFVKHYAWSPEKNEWLKRERGIGFEDVVFHIEAGDEVDLFEHPNQERYPGQKISIVMIEGYAYLVPFVESDTEIFLKTVIPSRKASRQHPGESNEQT